MLKNFKFTLPRIGRFSLREPQTLVRAVLGVLLLANLVAAYFAFNPPGGSLEEQERQIAQLRKQITTRQAAVDRLKTVVDKVSKAKSNGEEFMAVHFLNRRTAYSTLMTELEAAAKAAGVKPRDHGFNFEPIEGSDSLGLLTITANYEGTYADLIQFVNQLDRTKRLLILEMLQAQPQSGGQVLAISMKLFAFIREDGSSPVATPDASQPVAMNAGARP